MTFRGPFQSELFYDFMITDAVCNRKHLYVYSLCLGVGSNFEIMQKLINTEKYFFKKKETILRVMCVCIYQSSLPEVGNFQVTVISMRILKFA